MIDYGTEVKLRLYFKTGIEPILDKIIEAGLTIVEEEYIDQSPANFGTLKQHIQIRKRKPLDYVVESTAREKGKNYPQFLYGGTLKLKGKPDYGFTTGRVRSGDVAYGIGGIRPNKAAARTVEAKEDEFISKLKVLLNQELL